MKVVCGACQAKYQIPDERVAGRKLKIRCRKCGDAIIVRGDLLAPEPQPEEPTHVNGHHDAGARAEWHLSIDGEQHGPYPTDQMASMLRDGHVAWDTYAWREGYPDWKTAAESDTLVRAVASMPAPEAAAERPEPVAAPVVDDDGPTRMVGSVPPGSLAPVARASFSQRAHRAQSAPPGEVAAVAAASPFPQREAHSNGHGYGARPYVSAEQAMTGERHEDSVLFSTKNLQAVSHSQAVPPRNGFASSEGSGLIDIRALAALARGGQHSAPVLPTTTTAVPVDTEPVRRDDVMALASQTGAFSNLDSLRPFETAPRQSSNAVPIAIVTGSALIAAAAVFAVYLTREPVPAQPVAAAAISQPADGLGAAAALPSAAPEEPAPEPGAAAAAEAEAESERATEKPEAEAAPERTASSERRSRAASANRRPSPVKGESRAKAEAVISAEKAKPAPAPKAEKEAKAEKETKADKGESGSIDDLLLADGPKPEEKAEKPAISVDDVIADKKPASSKSRSIDELLDTAVIEGSKKPAKAAAEPSAASAALPDTPSRDQVKSAMKAITSDVKACAAGQTLESPTATASITVSGSTGKVSSVRMTGVQGAVGSCIAKVARGASFPKFAKETFSFDYPFRLQ